MSDTPIPISALEHWEYCPRQCALILVDNEWDDNPHTVRGAVGHRRVDSGVSRLERGRQVLRAVPLWSERLDLTGRADAVEIGPNGEVRPVEYKIGRRHGLAADIQVCAQALCLEEMLATTIPEAAIWYSSPRRRVSVTLDDSLRSYTEHVIEQIREVQRTGSLPSAPNDARCTQCQIRSRCRPEAVARASRVLEYLSEEVFGCGS